MKRAVVLLSGGLDSTTTLFFAQAQGYKVSALIFDYHQRHRKEVLIAKKIAGLAKCPYHIININLPWLGSSLLDKRIPLPKKRDLKTIGADKIPSTYVPARNIIFLSFAASFAEAIKAEKIFIGANARDYSGYPDCRPEFFKAYYEVLKKGSKTGVEQKAIKIETPLIHKTKAQIIKLGLSLKVPYHLTWSCYAGGRKPCGVCDSCILRQKGFSELNRKDPSHER
ncbi:MAG: 7-cyano-7-deazaguanine synthase QueC [Candidatus Omnitrophota bacterium]